MGAKQIERRCITKRASQTETYGLCTTHAHTHKHRQSKQARAYVELRVGAVQVDLGRKHDELACKKRTKWIKFSQVNAFHVDVADTQFESTALEIRTEREKGRLWAKEGRASLCLVPVGEKRKEVTSTGRRAITPTCENERKRKSQLKFAWEKSRSKQTHDKDTKAQTRPRAQGTHTRTGHTHTQTNTGKTRERAYIARADVRLVDGVGILAAEGNHRA